MTIRERAELLTHANWHLSKTTKFGTSCREHVEGFPYGEECARITESMALDGAEVSPNGDLIFWSENGIGYVFESL